MKVLARRALVALQTSAARRGNGLAAARVATVFDARGHAHVRAHVVASTPPRGGAGHRQAAKEPSHD